MPPGPIASDVEQDDASSHHRQQTVAKVPLGRMGTPAEVSRDPAVIQAYLGSSAA